MSLPSRKRGLKFLDDAGDPMASRSLPSRKRGLKSSVRPHAQQRAAVASFAEAWIEMSPIVVITL